MMTPPITRRARAGRVTLLATIPLLALVAVATGCGTVSTPAAGGGSSPTSSSSSGSGTAPTATASASPAPTTTGGTFTPGVAQCTGWPSTAAHVALPPSFIPVAVLRCVPGITTVPGKGQWSTATLQRADKDLWPLITALRLPPGHTSPGVMCPQIAMLGPQIALVDGSGKIIIPRIPLTGCGLVQSQVLAALDKLPWQTISVRLISQTQTPAHPAGGCASDFKDPFIVYGNSPRPSAGGAVFATQPAALRICIYSVAGSLNSQFLRGTIVTGATESTLLSGLSGARSTSVCSLPHAQFAVVSGDGPGDPLLYVELGGCHRVLRYETGSGGTMGVSMGQATPQALAIIQTVTHPKP